MLSHRPQTLPAEHVKIIIILRLRKPLPGVTGFAWYIRIPPDFANP